MKAKDTSLMQINPIHKNFYSRRNLNVTIPLQPQEFFEAMLRKIQAGPPAAKLVSQNKSSTEIKFRIYTN